MYLITFYPLYYIKMNKSKLELKLKKLCTYYYEWTVQGRYTFKINEKENKLFLQYDSDCTYKSILIDWLDDISYKISKNWIKENKFKYLFNMDYKIKQDKAKKELEKLAKIRNFKTEYYLR